MKRGGRGARASRFFRHSEDFPSKKHRTLIEEFEKCYKKNGFVQGRWFRTQSETNGGLNEDSI